MSKNLKPKHLSIRVHWHDNGWNGTVCKNPAENYCCSEKEKCKCEDSKNDWGNVIKDNKKYTECIHKRGAFLADKKFQYSYEYYEYNEKTTFTVTVQHPPYSAAVYPFRWGWNKSDTNKKWDYLKDKGAIQKEGRKIKINRERVNELFFSEIRSKESLCIFYTRADKKIGFPESSSKGSIMVVGIGRVLEVIQAEADSNGNYPYDANFIQHSIRGDYQDGFILPYITCREEFLKKIKEEDLENYIVYAPNYDEEFSYVCEHVSDDTAIEVLLSCKNAVIDAEAYAKEWKERYGENVLKWINDRLGELWQKRGVYPGLGAVLEGALGLKLGVLIAEEIKANIKEDEDPWDYVDKIFKQPDQAKNLLPEELAEKITDVVCQKWTNIDKDDESKEFLKLISRLQLTVEEVKYLFEKFKKKDHKEMLSNPYLIYEKTRDWVKNNIDLERVDRGIFPPTNIRKKFPLPGPSAVSDISDKRRIRAFIIKTLEEEAEKGHTLMPVDGIKEKIKKFKNSDEDPISLNDYTLKNLEFGDEIKVVDVFIGKIKKEAYQLDRLYRAGEIIREEIEKRKGKTISEQVKVDENYWHSVLNRMLGENKNGDPKEKESRDEKVSALDNMIRFPIFVLIGPAGTGKTTLLKALHDYITKEEKGKILFLTPTGKAKVVLKEKLKDSDSSDNITVFNIAEYLNDRERFWPDRKNPYKVKGKKEETSDYDNVVIDEASMLTEEMLAAVIETVSNAKRIILVGDPGQLPPIGPGKPFVDIIRYLENEDNQKKCYGELTVQHRQAEDSLWVKLARTFSWGAEKKTNSVINGMDCSLKEDNIEWWEDKNELYAKIKKRLEKDLGIKDGESLRKSFGFNDKRKLEKNKAESWQILTPKNFGFEGVFEINKFIQKEYYNEKNNYSISDENNEFKYFFGDKVINIQNKYYDKKYFIANGEIGLITFVNTEDKNRNITANFISQPGNVYYYENKKKDKLDIKECLDLAYALTVHKAQGSQFEKVFLILPKSWLYKELIYTALTRHEENLTIFIEKSLKDSLCENIDKIKRNSAIDKRITNLFSSPCLILIDYNDDFQGYERAEYKEEPLIHRTEKGELVRSKSEVIIANILYKNNIEYKYEKELVLYDENGERKIVKPDFTIIIHKDGATKEYYWEHLGMLSNDSYRKNWKNKEKLYKLNNITRVEDGGNLIITEDDLKEEKGIDSVKISEIISTLFK
ncbi:ATP-dependent exoDNAse (exonuclease V), alpha subunit, helicase superfamily I [Thermosyntropha lipolytica DSM 11003]|uniref:ATP-dependent exoDNAse (Exonuclease V), alpha subunit, helicase superfamily I n=1 Tax=Thermosyntropha lipolytica DSM 11003 TaxID=1123382 RepID=A0A1M5PJK9_9FIRM|nr:ATP-dependent RecD-like DNA helicase [Thermosyntropha lipolytica]SHH01921.1 ATP-dependent exoDNAse (exonuclease V), alpha subunit, helicase superfamily I [Thermosyntropha lipolytica DSM 11003]